MEIEMLDAPEVREEPATAITLSPETRAVIALNSSKTELDLRALATKHVSIVEIKDRAGREQAHGAAMELMRARTDIEKASKAARDDATKFSKAVIAEEKRLVAIVGTEEKRLKDLRDQWDAAEAAEKAERERIAAEKKLVVDNAMTWIRNHAIQAVGKSAADIKELMSSLETMEVTLETFADRAGEAEQCRLMTLEVLAGLHAAVAAQEEAAAKVEAERIRLERERLALAAAAKAAAEQKAIDDAALAAAPAVIEPTESFGEITIDAAYGDIEYITATAITDPSDADVIFTAARAVSLEYGLTMGDAIHRLAAVESWTQIEGAAA